MIKIGILTFHYSNNYGAILQALALEQTIRSLGYEVEIINYVPSSYKPNKISNILSLNRNFFAAYNDGFSIIDTIKKISIIRKHGNDLSNKISAFKSVTMNVSKRVNENTLNDILNEYSVIVVGSDQIWNPSQRQNPIYFLNFSDRFIGKKISYAADSTTSNVDKKDFDLLKKALKDFAHISVRNDHSHDFVKSILNIDVPIVADPTLLYDFNEITIDKQIDMEYILMYVLGKEIIGSHEQALTKIKSEYGNIPIYSIKIPTMNFELSPFADKIFYDLDPQEWINLFRNAKFIYTDSFHGVLFSLKFHIPFLAYYTEKLRATRFIDIGNRYQIARYIIQDVSEIDENELLKKLPDFTSIDEIIKSQKQASLIFLKKSLAE